MRCAVPRPRDEWEIKDDARTLARAEEIKADKERLKEATTMARQLADEEAKRIQGIMKVAGRKVPSTGQQEAAFNRRSFPNPATIGRL